MLADATGHGIGPALTATEVRALLRMAVRAGLGLDAIAAQLNDQLNEDLGQGRFVTAWLAEVDSDQGRVRALSAGQAPILVFRKARGQCEILAADGPPLGVLPGIAPSTRGWCDMSPGDILAAISDGIYEATNPDQEQFGAERTIAVIEANHERPAQTIRERLLEQLTGVGCMGLLCRYTFNSHTTDISALTRVLKGNGTDVSLAVDVQRGIFIQIPGFNDVTVSKLNVERVGIIEILYFHGLYPRSKNAL